jgi:hypothetical protein
VGRGPVRLVLHRDGRCHRRVCRMEVSTFLAIQRHGASDAGVGKARQYTGRTIWTYMLSGYARRLTTSEDRAWPLLQTWDFPVSASAES